MLPYSNGYVVWARCGQMVQAIQGSLVRAIHTFIRFHGDTFHRIVYEAPAIASEAVDSTGALKKRLATTAPTEILLISKECVTARGARERDGSRIGLCK